MKQRQHEERLLFIENAIQNGKVIERYKLYWLPRIALVLLVVLVTSPLWR